MLEEFKKFAMRGNVIDLAVGVIIGAAFGKMIDSVVNDLIMPLIGVVFGYGSFLTALLNFIIIALALFLLIRGINKLGAKHAEAPAAAAQ